MTIQTKKEYLAVMRSRYQTSQKRDQKTAIISELVNNLKVHRKSAVRSLNHHPPIYRKPIPGRKEVYGYELIRPLTQIWEIAGSPCSKRLKPQIGEIISRLKVFNEIKLYPDKEKLLRKMSTFTIDRLLEEPRGILTKEYGLSGTKKSPLLKTLIPVRTSFDDISEPGHLEMDCVLHCGDTLTGHYGETLNLLDIHTHWNEKKIFFKKTKAKIIGAVHELRPKFPFPIKSLDFDNGTEFVNWSLHGYCKREEIDFTRSRSYHKNDQAHIEGKNYHSVRKVTGYSRISDPKIIALMDDLYQNEHRLLTNYFYTTMKLESKKRCDATGKSTKKYQVAKTPYQRVLESSTIPKAIKQKLTEEYLSLNPAQLQRNFKEKLLRIHSIL
jgi:hypothetical protein